MSENKVLSAWPSRRHSNIVQALWSPPSLHLFSSRRRETCLYIQEKRVFLFSIDNWKKLGLEIAIIGDRPTTGQGSHMISHKSISHFHQFLFFSCLVCKVAFTASLLFEDFSRMSSMWSFQQTLPLRPFQKAGTGRIGQRSIFVFSKTACIQNLIGLL